MPQTVCLGVPTQAVPKTSRGHSSATPNALCYSATNDGTLHWLQELEDQGSLNLDREFIRGLKRDHIKVCFFTLLTVYFFAVLYLFCCFADTARNFIVILFLKVDSIPHFQLSETVRLKNRKTWPQKIKVQLPAAVEGSTVNKCENLLKGPAGVLVLSDLLKFG